MAGCRFIKCASKVGLKWHAVGSSNVLARLGGSGKWLSSRLVASANWLDSQVC